ncbi:MAG: class I SAM-dependent methyltransferase [Chloroflexota bacterium]|nr:class I SAM-dependent methyltransferase [Chloroflexota bacterium]
MTLEYVTCNLCGADDTEIVYPSTLNGHNEPDARAYNCTNFGYGIHHTIVKCQRCGLVYANPRFTQSDLIEEYEHVVDPLYEQEREGRVLTFQRHLEPIEQMVGDYRGKRILDVGAYTGVFVELAQQRGWDAYGTELSQWAARLCRKRGLNVKTGTLEQAEFPDDWFDVVTSWDVIEHLNDPRSHLEEVHRVLKPGGLVAIHTIDIDAPFARLMGARWPWLMEMHIVYFSRKTLARMLESVGFDVIHAEPQGRYQRVSYLVSRLQAVNHKLWRIADTATRWLQVDELAIPINLGDLVTTYAVKRGGAHG